MGALDGGRVDMPALATISGGGAGLTSDGASSVLSAPALTSFTGDDGYHPASSLQATDNGTIQTGNLTSLDYVSLTLDDTGHWAANQLTSTSEALAAKANLPCLKRLSASRSWKTTSSWKVSPPT